MECALDPCEYSPAYAALMVAQRAASTVDLAMEVKIGSPVAVDTKGKSKLKSHYLIMDFPSVNP